MKENTQAGAILAALRSGRKLTALGALDDFGCFRLASRISELKKEGHDIKVEMIEVGPEKKRIARYSLEYKDERQLMLNL